MSVNINDLWIGDVVILGKSGREGKFVGKSPDGRARISVDQKILLVSVDQLSLKPINDAFPDHLLENLLEDLEIENRQLNKPLKIKANYTLDLHIDKLQPNMTNDFPGKIIEFQLAQCKIFIDEAIRFRYPVITIIHGKGQGVLKREVEALVQSYTTTRFKVPKNDGGAIEVWFDQ